MYPYNIYSLQFELPPVQPITVSIGVDIKDIPKVSDTDFAITLNAYFIVKWHDSRLIVEGRKRDRGSVSCKLDIKLHIPYFLNPTKSDDVYKT